MSKRECPDGQILNPKTNRCVSLTGKIGKELIASSSFPKKSTHIAEKVKILTKSKDVVESKTCPDGQILNPKTNRCVSAKGAIGQALLLLAKEKSPVVKKTKSPVAKTKKSSIVKKTKSPIVKKTKSPSRGSDVFDIIKQTGDHVLKHLSLIDKVKLRLMQKKDVHIFTEELSSAEVPFGIFGEYANTIKRYGETDAGASIFGTYKKTAFAMHFRSDKNVSIMINDNDCIYIVNNLFDNESKLKIYVEKEHSPRLDLPSNLIKYLMEDAYEKKELEVQQRHFIYPNKYFVDFKTKPDATVLSRIYKPLPYISSNKNGDGPAELNDQTYELFDNYIITFQLNDDRSPYGIAVIKRDFKVFPSGHSHYKYTDIMRIIIRDKFAWGLFYNDNVELLTQVMKATRYAIMVIPWMARFKRMIMYPRFMVTDIQNMGRNLN